MKSLYLLIILAPLIGAFSTIASAKSPVCRVNSTHIRIMEDRLKLFKEDVERLPYGDEGLKSLISRGENMAGWKGPYLKGEKILMDTWGREFVYLYPARYGNKEFDLYSFGEDGKDDHGGADDISNWAGYDKWIYHKNDSISDAIKRVLIIGIIIALIFRLRKMRIIKNFFTQKSS